jgi:HAMP domain-containing protein
MAIFILALLIVLTLLSYAIHRWVEEPGKNILMIPQRLRVSAKTV